MLSPFAWLVAGVFKTREALNEYVFFPPLSKWSETMNLDNFRQLFEGRPSIRGPVYFWQYFLNSTVFATVITTLQILFCSMGGYALAKYEFRGKAALTLFMLGSMMIPSALLLAPLYKMIVDLGLVDSLAGVIVPRMVSAYGIFLFRQACITVPGEMLDAARLDGCSEFGIYLRVVMPLVRPMAAAFCLVAFLANWNAFFAPNIFLHSDDKLTVPGGAEPAAGRVSPEAGRVPGGDGAGHDSAGDPVLFPAARVHQRPDVRRRQGLAADSPGRIAWT